MLKSPAVTNLDGGHDPNDNDGVEETRATFCVFTMREKEAFVFLKLS